MDYKQQFKVFNRILQDFVGVFESNSLNIRLVKYFMRKKQHDINKNADSY